MEEASACLLLFSKLLLLLSPLELLLLDDWVTTNHPEHVAQ